MPRDNSPEYDYASAEEYPETGRHEDRWTDLREDEHTTHHDDAPSQWCHYCWGPCADGSGDCGECR